MKDVASTFRIVKEVFSNRNVLVISLTSMIAFGVFNSLWNMWWSLYLLEALDASIPIVGLLAMIQNSSSLLFQLPGGILADRFGRRRVIGLGTSLRIVAPIFFLLAKSWVWVIPGIIANAAASIYSPAFNALIAESLPPNRRATAFGAYRMITSIPSIFMPTLSGIYIDQMSLIQGTRALEMVKILEEIGIKITREAIDNTMHAGTKTVKNRYIKIAARKIFSK